MSLTPSNPANQELSASARQSPMFPSAQASSEPKPRWKIIIADDDLDVHHVTKIALRSFNFNGMGLEIIDTYTGQETCDVLRKNPDTAVILLDVVMESIDAGLKAVKYIREEIGNKMVRIILRTGQPGHAPEEKVVLNYHINDYKSKSDLTSRAMFTSLVSSLRSYQDLQTIETSRRGLLKVLDAASGMDFRSRSLFVSGLLAQLSTLLDINTADLILIRQVNDAIPTTGNTQTSAGIMAATGKYDSFIGEMAEDILPPETVQSIHQVFRSATSDCDGQRSLHLIQLAQLYDVVMYIGSARTITEAELSLIQVFCLKIVLAYENFEFVEHARRDQHAELVLLAQLSSKASYLTVSHTINRGRLSSALASHLLQSGMLENMPHWFPEIIERAAILADIGNYCLPATLLESSAPLSDAERLLQQSHTVKGLELLDKVLSEVSGGRVTEMARQIILSHHEAYDGSGYPQQLSGDLIPLAARIVAVADSYLALTTERPWRAEVSHDEAISEITRTSEKKYDPLILSSFLVICDDFRKA